MVWGSAVLCHDTSRSMYDVHVQPRQGREEMVAKGKQRGSSPVWTPAPQRLRLCCPAFRPEPILWALTLPEVSLAKL